MKHRLALPLIAIVSVGTIVLPARVPGQNQSAIEAVSHSATEFAIDMYGELVKEEAEKNLFFSPYSMYTVLALMYGGAAGETAEQMASALHVQTEPEVFQTGLNSIQDILNQIGERDEIELNIANSLWPQSGATLKPEFLELAKSYFTEVYPVDYRREAAAVRKRINAWGEKETNGRIKNILVEPLHPETHLLLANAIFFKGDWARQFDKAKTESMPFHRFNAEPMEVPMMFQLGNFPFAWTESAKILQLPFQGGDLSMTIVLPEDPRGLPAIEKSITAADIASWQEELFEEDVYVQLPRFRITSAFNLREDGNLRDLGIVRALHPRKAEFPGIGPYANWFSIQIFVHKAFVEVNEQGTEAAAVTVGGCFPAGTPVPTPEGLVPIEAIETGTVVYSVDLAKGEWVTSRVVERRPYPFAGQMVSIRMEGDSIQATWNHPFLFFIRDESTGSTLFMGRVMDPSEK